MIKIKYKLLRPTAKAPVIAFDSTDNTMGIDVFSDRDVVMRIVNKHSTDTDHPHPSYLPYVHVPTGISLVLPPRTHVSWGGRSGLAFRDGLLPFEGKIDSNYRNEIMLKLWSMNPEFDNYTIPAGTKIAQLYIIQYSDTYTLEETNEDEHTDRKGGFGSTGTR